MATDLEPDYLEQEVRRRARKVGIRREDLPDDPEEALELLPQVRGRTATTRHHEPKPVRRRRPEPLPVDPSNIGGAGGEGQPAGADVKPSSSSTPKPSSKPKTPATKRARPASSPRAGRARGRSSRARREARRAASSATAPVYSAGRNIVTLAVWALGLVVVYQLLESAPVVTKLLEAPSRALRWLSDPTRSIPYAPDPD